MITNQRQYRITKAQLQRFGAALADLQERLSKHRGPHQTLIQAQVDALRSQIDELREQLAEYDALEAGREKVLEAPSFAELPRVLIRARIASGLSQKNLAERLGIKEQQVQRYEATEYASASLTRIKEVVDALGLRVRGDVFLPSVGVSLDRLTGRLAEVGITREFLLRRLLPADLAEQVAQVLTNKVKEAARVVLQTASIVGRVFNWPPSAILAGSPLPMNAAVLGTRYKVASNVNPIYLSAYTVYAHYLALLVLDAVPESAARPLSTDPQRVRSDILSRYGSLDLRGILEYVWDLGVPVLPLRDRGTFHGACWRVEGRNVIALKQTTASQSRWTFDLLHELWEAAQEPENPDRTVVETSEPLANTEEDEASANAFAGDVLLNGRAEELATICATTANMSVEKLKAIVPQVARRENVPVDALANYMAFRLAFDRVNWWGAASNLQGKGTPPFSIAREVLMKRVHFDRLNSVDAHLMLKALSDQWE